MIEEDELGVVHDPPLGPDDGTGWHLAEQVEALLSLLGVQWHIGQPEDRLHNASHSQHGVDRDGVRLTKQPVDEVLKGGVQVRSGRVVHQAPHKAGHQVARHRDDPGATSNAALKCLVVVARPALHALLFVLGNAVVARALLDAHEALTGLELQQQRRLHVLAGAARNVVDDARPLVEEQLEVPQDAGLRGLAVIRVDLKRGVHASGEALLRRLEAFGGVVRASVSHDDQSVAELGRHVPDEGEELRLRHEMALAGGAGHDHSVHAVLDLPLQKFVIGINIDFAVREEWGLDGSHQQGFLHALNGFLPRGLFRKQGDSDPVFESAISHLRLGLNKSSPAIKRFSLLGQIAFLLNLERLVRDSRDAQVGEESHQ
mmetsp:Transcript_3668/g.6435  ORF Transcript_3668/g.6435 Transcript_3668/m.6435 type:complete len:373 (-) Transcript_3668:37-1155(-)